MKKKYSVKMSRSRNMIGVALFPLLVAALACLAAPSPLLADSVGLTLFALAQAAPDAPQIFQVTGVTTPINDPGQTAAFSSSAGGFVITDSGSASGTVNFGSISGDVTASAFASSPDPAVLPGAIVGSSGNGQFTGEWQDSITVTSATLAVGTPVNLLFTLAVNG